MKIRRMFKRLKGEARIYYSLFKDERTPKISKLLIVAAVAYLVWPFDLIPDFIPFAGQLDEVVIIPLLFYLATYFIPKEVVDEYKYKSKSYKGQFKNVQEGEVIS